MENTIVFAHVDDQGLATVIITDKEYPDSAAKKILVEMKHRFL